MTSTINWSGAGVVNGPQDIGASIFASYTNFSPTFASGGGGGGYSQYDQFEEFAEFTDVLTSNQSFIDTPFHFTVSGSSSGGDASFPFQVYVGFGVLNVVDNGVNGNFTADLTANDGAGQYDLTIELIATVNVFDRLGTFPAAGANLSANSNYLDTLTLDSVTLAPGQTAIDQSGINYGDLSPVPEPSSIVLLSTVLAGLVLATGRRTAANRTR